MHRLVRRARAALPTGRPLSDELWERRHRGVVALLWLHAPGLLAVGLATHHSIEHSFTDILPIVLCAAVAMRTGRSRQLRSSATTLGLVASSAILVHLTNGNIEMHFHFFVMVGVITLYQDWLPFGLAILFVVLHHGVLGVLLPSAVYNHDSARHNPWLWAGIHGAFVLAASVAHILAWRLNEDQALRDALTRLPNRALFSDRLRFALARHQRYGQNVTVLFIDLDGFKVVNDTLGHAVGDRLLVEVGERIQEMVRQTDTAARLGGDEFAVLLDGHDAAGAMVVAQRILRGVARPVRVDGHERTVGASIGLVSVSRETTVDQVLRNADLAMYMAKAAGRGRIEVFEDSMFDHAVEQADLERDLRDAITEGALTVSYQPCVDLETGAVRGVEALVRWNHRIRGSVPPSVFIPIAEANGLILPLGRYVLRVACADAARLRATQPGLTVAVNVSARQLMSESLVDDVAHALVSANLDPEALVLEITESVLVQDVDLTVRRLTELKQLGIRIAIDDFGTGYSSLSYLRHFPIDILKIDRSFVEHLPGEGLALTRSIVRLGQSMRLDVVAEGVEEDGQRTELTRLGCRSGQGFLFAEARPVAQVESLLAEAQQRAVWWVEPVAVPAPRTPADDLRTASTTRPSSAY